MIDFDKKVVELVCEITKKEAAIIGNFIGIDGIKFTPFCQETSGGKYIVTKKDYEREKYSEEINRIDFSKKKWIDVETIEFRNAK